MPDITASNGREALVAVADHVMDYGEIVEPRGMVTREVQHLTVEIENPRDTLCTGIGANQSIEVAAAEALQLIGGFSDPAFAVQHAPALAAFVNDLGQFDGAYGPRINYQLDMLVHRLKNDADTRQAVLTIWDQSDVFRTTSKDYPCTLDLVFAIRAGRLNLSAFMRSNDVNWGFKNDIFQFTQLQLTLARVLGIEAGVYRHTAVSMHLYERDFEWADQLSLDYHDDEFHPQGVVDEDGINGVKQAARSIALNGEDWQLDPSNRWYCAALNGAKRAVA